MGAFLPENAPVIRASVFSSFPDVLFGFTTRHGNVDFHLGIGVEHLAIPKQVHGGNVIRVFKPGKYEGCDALTTSEKKVYLSINVADCLPIFIYDPGYVAVAAVHAGWRGCIERIVEKTISAMVEEFDSDPPMLRVFIGPSARVCCYEVGNDVASQFDERFLFRKNTPRPHLDMLAFTQHLLATSGVQQSHIEVSPYCTICTPNLFHSYRRDREKSGRMVGIIGIQSY